MRARLIDIAVVMGLAVGASLTISSDAVLVGVWVAVAYLVGRSVEARWRLNRESDRLRDALEVWIWWAECTLAATSEDLDDEQEALRRRLQAVYRRVQSVLRQS